MSTERVDILVESGSLQSALTLAQQLDKTLNSLRTKKQFGTISGLSQSKTELQSYINELERLNKLRTTKLDAGLSTKSTDAAIKKVTANIKSMEAGFDSARNKVVSLGTSMRSTFNRISSTTMHAGQQMQVLGKTLTQISSPMRTLFRSTVWASGFKVLNTVTEGLSNGFERADIMRKFPRVMQSMGFSADKAQESITRLEQSVLGLPTGLDEMVDMAQRFVSTTGNLTKGTDLAIAANNAFLASMTTEAQKYQGMMQLQDVIGGKDMTAKEWNSLYSSMSGAVRLMGESLGYTGKELDEYAEAVRTGEIANEDFLDTLIKAGTDPSGKIRKVAEESMDTWEAFFSRIRTASSNLMFKGIIEPLNELVNTLSGGKFESVNLLLDDLIYNGINNMRNSIADWIRANPDKIIDFFNTLKGIDIKGFLKGAGEGLGKTLEFYKGFIEMFSGKGMEKFGYFMARAGFWGRGLNLLGGALKGLRAPIAAIGTVLAHIPAINARMVAGTGIFGFLGKLIGKKKDADTIAQTAKTFPTFKQSLQSLVSGLTGALKVFGTVAIGAGTGFVVFKTFKSIFADIKAMTDIAGDINWDSAKKIMVGMAGFMAAFSLFSAGAAALPAASGFVLGGELILGAITGLASGIAKLVTGNLKKAFANFEDITKSLNNALENVKNIKEVEINKDAIQGAVDSLSTVYNLLKPQYQGTGIQNMSARQAKTMKDVVASMVDTLKSLGDLKDVAKDLSGFEVFSEELSTNVQNAFKSLGKMFSGFTESFGLGAETNTRAATKITGNIKDTFTNLVGEGGVLSQIKQIAPALKELDTATSLNEASPLQQARHYMDRLFTDVGEMFDGFAGKIGFNAEGNTSLASKVIENVTDTFDKLVGEKGIISQISSLNEKLPSIISGGERGKTPMESVKSQLDSLFTAIGGIYESITSEKGLGLYTKVTRKSSERVNEVFENIKTMFDSLVGEDGIIGKISQLAETLPNLVAGTSTQGRGATPMDNVKVMLQNMFSALNDIYSFINEETAFGTADISAFTESIGQLPTIMDSIQQAVTKLGSMQESMTGMAGEDGSFPIVQQIKDMISQLSATFSAETIAVLQAQVEGFKATVTSLIESITSMTGMSEGAPVELAITFTHTISGADEAVAAIKAADNAIRSAVNAIQTSYTKTITVTLSPVVNRLPMPSTSYYPHTGGFIGNRGVQYRASGGSIFRKRGSDIVPAMLTPGEYVENKKAVKYFGIDFMRKVNNLDLHGALNSLLQRAGNMASASTTINNYNNQKVVINNNGSTGAGFTFKQAGRFVGAI